MKEATFRRYSILGHVGAWMIFFMIYFMEEFDYSDFIPSILYAFAVTLVLMTTVYTHYYLLLPLFFKKRRWIYFFSTFLLLSFFSAVQYFVDQPFMNEFPDENYFWGDFIYYFCLLTLVVAVSSLYAFVEAWYANLRSGDLLRSEKLQAELNFLKSQINPHFLFNTLNNIYAYAQTGNQKTAPMLERLSSILRFMVYDCSEERVSLLKELEAVEDLLEIYKMKNSTQNNIKLSINGVLGYHLIAPLIIVNLVENACKHSDAVNNPEGFIQVNITVGTADDCLVEISNSWKPKVTANTKYQGVGLENIKKRLDLQYRMKHTFEEERAAKVYTIRLSLPLERKG